MQMSSRFSGESFDGLTISALGRRQMSRVVAVAAFTGDAVVREERHVVFVFGAGIGACEALVWHVRQPGNAGKFIGMIRDCWKAGRGIPDFFLRVPVDRRFEEEIVQ